MKRLLIILALLPALPLLAAEPPNIGLILADDQGYEDIG